MREGAVLKGLTAGQRAGRKVLRAQVATNLAVPANLEIIRQLRAFADERNAGVQPGGFQLVGRHIIAVANLAILANDDLLIQDGTVNHTASADDRVKEYDRVTDNGPFLDNDSRREHAALDLSLDDTAMRDEAARDLGPTANMRWWALLTARVNHPRGIIEVEGRALTKQFHMCLPVGLHGAHILPVAGKGIGIDALASRHHCRNNVVAEVMLGGRSAGFSRSCVLDEDADQRVAIEYVDAHRTQCTARLLRLLLKRDDPPPGIRFQNAKTVTLLGRYDHGAQGDIGTMLLVKGDHRRIVHAINMVTGQHEHIVATRFHNEAEILVNRVGGALVPI